MIKPYKDQPGTRKEQVQQMFNTIAGKYDFLNHFLSFNTDVRWRRKVRRLIKKLASESGRPLEELDILDVATGTGDMAIELSKLKPHSITGVDLAVEMLRIARKKADERKIPGMTFQQGDSEALEFPDKNFDFVTVAFGVRNYENLEKGLFEMQRVLKPGGHLMILEFSIPSGIMGFLYRIYSKHILPRMARLFTNDPAAYVYLPESISVFPHGKEMTGLLLRAGFSTSKCIRLSGGIASLYVSARG
jgi:demethylmenaquinone methyltransferase / 2-methoxy-6-polyprenyl-1,4-benzoquinol methylase